MIQNMGQNLGEFAWIFNIDLKYFFQLFMAIQLDYDNDQIREVVLQAAQSIVQDAYGDKKELEEDKKEQEDKKENIHEEEEDKEGGEEEEHASIHLLTHIMLALCCITKGTNFDIAKLSKKYDDFKNVSKFEQFYKACKGDLKSMKPILDGLRLSQHKKIIIEFCHLLKGEEIDLEEIPGRIGLIPEHSQLFTNLFNFMITCSKYAIIVRNGNIEELKKKVYIDKIITKLSDIHLCMTKGLNAKPAIDFEILSLRIGNDKDLKKAIKVLKKAKKIKTKIDDEALLIIATKIVNDIEKKEENLSDTYDDIIEELISFLNIKEEKKRIIAAICNLALRFISNIDVFDQRDNEALKNDLEKVSILLGIKEEYLIFVLAIMTGNPYTVFGCKDVNPTIDLENLEISGAMQDTNLIIIAEALDISFNEAKKLGALWIYHFNNINQGERYIPELAAIIGVDPQFLYLISKFA